jgi:hypothetical protein
MSKRKIRFKLGEITIKNVELEIEDEREIATAIFSEVQNKLANAVQPGFNTVLLGIAEPVSESTNGKPVASENKGKSKTSKGSRSSGDGGGTQPIEFRHDASKFGNPQQSWTVTDKCVWLLYVVEGITGTKEIAGAQLAATYNQQFKPSGKIHPPHVGTHLGKSKVQNPPYVGEDKGLWYLTDEGKKYAQQLTAAVLSPA